MIQKKEAKLLKKLIKANKNIIIAKHIKPDWDAQGSAMGLAYIIKENFKDKNIFVVGDRLDDNKDFPTNHLTDEIIKDSLVITVDTGNKERLDFDKFDLAKDTFKIDHHIDVDRYANNQIICVSAIANTVVVTYWANMLKMKITQQAAQNLYLGLLTDSGRFLYNKVNSTTFDMASVLLKSGVNISGAHDYLYVKDLKTKKWFNFAFSKMNLTDFGVGYIVLKPEDYQGWDFEYYQIKSALNTMSGIDEIKAWFLIIELEDEIKISFRSRHFDVNQVAIKYNGGGHKSASGGTLLSFEDLPQLIEDMNKLIKGEFKNV